MPSLVDSGVSPDRRPNTRSWCVGMALEPTELLGQAPSLLSDRLSRLCLLLCLVALSPPCLSPLSLFISLSLSWGFFHFLSLSLSLISLLLCLPPPLPAPPHILSCLWGTGNLGDQRDTRRLSCCCLEIIHGGGGAGLDGGWGSTAWHTQRQTEELCHFFGPQCQPLWIELDDPSPWQESNQAAWPEQAQEDLVNEGREGGLGQGI